MSYLAFNVDIPNTYDTTTINPIKTLKDKLVLVSGIFTLRNVPSYGLAYSLMYTYQTLTVLLLKNPSKTFMNKLVFVSEYFTLRDCSIMLF